MGGMYPVGPGSDNPAAERTRFGTKDSARLPVSGDDRPGDDRGSHPGLLIQGPRESMRAPSGSPPFHAQPLRRGGATSVSACGFRPGVRECVNGERRHPAAGGCQQACCPTISADAIHEVWVKDPS